MTGDDRDPVADYLPLKLWEPEPLAGVEFHERLTAADRGYYGVRSAVDLPSRMPSVEVHEPQYHVRVAALSPARADGSSDGGKR